MVLACCCEDNSARLGAGARTARERAYLRRATGRERARAFAVSSRAGPEGGLCIDLLTHYSHPRASRALGDVYLPRWIRRAG